MANDETVFPRSPARECRSSGFVPSEIPGIQSTYTPDRMHPGRLLRIAERIAHDGPSPFEFHARECRRT